MNQKSTKSEPEIHSKVKHLMSNIKHSVFEALYSVSFVINWIICVWRHCVVARNGGRVFGRFDFASWPLVWHSMIEMVHSSGCLWGQNIPLHLSSSGILILNQNVRVNLSLCVLHFHLSITKGEVQNWNDKYFWTFKSIFHHLSTHCIIKCFYSQSI